MGKKLSCCNRDCQNYKGPGTLAGHLKWCNHQEDFTECASCHREEKAKRAARKVELARINDLLFAHLKPIPPN